MHKCGFCRTEVSKEAVVCPACGAEYSVFAGFRTEEDVRATLRRSQKGLTYSIPIFVVCLLLVSNIGDQNPSGLEVLLMIVASVLEVLTFIAIPVAIIMILSCRSGLKRGPIWRKRSS